MTETHDPATTDRVYVVVDSPIDPLALESDGEHLIGVWMSPHRVQAARQVAAEHAPAVLAEASAELEAYFARELDSFAVPVRFDGTDFQRRVWRCLQDIPYGQTWTYAQLANAVGAPGAARAVGLANGRNPVSIVVPCHRVIGADGSLTGYAGGVARKRALLDLESGQSESMLW